MTSKTPKVHFCVGTWAVFCGGGGYPPAITRNPKEVTCKRCLKKLKRSYHTRYDKILSDAILP